MICDNAYNCTLLLSRVTLCNLFSKRTSFINNHKYIFLIAFLQNVIEISWDLMKIHKIGKESVFKIIANKSQANAITGKRQCLNLKNAPRSSWTVLFPCIDVVCNRSYAGSARHLRVPWARILLNVQFQIAQFRQSVKVCNCLQFRMSGTGGIGIDL